jgi:hypothetical protein
MELKQNGRGFKNGIFTDLYGNVCSIQESSLATENAIWLGIDNPELVIFENENRGKYIKTVMPKTFSVNSRIHLTREQVAELLPFYKNLLKLVNCKII